MLDRTARACIVSLSASRDGSRPLSLPEPSIPFADYGSLIEAIERRRVELGLTQIEVDDLAGLASGHYSHIASWRSAQGRSLGPTTLARVLCALGLKLMVIADKAVEHGRRVASMARG